MLAIILGILKFIGLLLLGILGLLAGLLLLVLLVPVRYRARGSYYEELKGTAGASWLLHILSCQVRYEGELDMCIRVFGIRIGGRKHTGEAGPEEEKHAAPKPVPEKRAVPEKDKSAVPEKDKSAPSEPKSEKSAPPKPESAPKKHKKFSFGNLFEKIRVTFQRICDKLKTLNEKKEEVLAFINREDNRRTFRLMKKQVFALAKHILPGKVKGKARFGFDNPYTTGQILTWISPFYGLYAKKFQLIPVFEEKTLEGELDLKGRIRIGTLLVIILRMFLDKNFRKILKKWREA